MERSRSLKPEEVRPTEQQIMWQNLELTAFFHFTVNTFTGKEWGNGKENPAIFNPTELDCRQWIRTIKEAGFKLAILTAKHHDGFCLWQTAYSDHSVKSSHWKNGKGDVLREFVEACKEYDILPGVYLSPWDRNHPDYGSPAYNDYFVNQLKEVLTGYGPFYEVWFDGACAEGPNGRKQVYDWNRYYKTIRELAPEAVISICGPDIRWVGNEHGYGHKTEWNIVSEGRFDQAQIEEQFEDFHYEDREGLKEEKEKYKKYPKTVPSPVENGENWIWYPSEVDVSIRPGWFFHKTQNRLVKSHHRMVDIYYSSVGYGSGLLLNFPPDRRGLVHEADIKRLKQVRKTLAKTFENALGMDLQFEKDGKEIICPLKSMTDIDRIVLQEDIRQGQYAEEFEVQYQEKSGQWKPLSRGTTIGYKRILRTRKVRAKAVKLIIKKALADKDVHIQYFNVFKSSRKDRCPFYKRD